MLNRNSGAVDSEKLVVTGPQPSDAWEQEVSQGHRFGFGRNWSRFLETLSESKIGDAEHSLKEMLGRSTLEGARFLDAGSGSGLFSLAARRLGAEVHSFDFDPNSVGCTMALRQRFFPRDDKWTVERGSVLDVDYLDRFGTFDVVYSWGVLHHTGAMWDALANMIPLVKGGGQLFIAIYNDQGLPSAGWLKVKRAYNGLPGPLKGIVLLPAFAWLWGPATVRDLLRGKPFHSWRNYGKVRSRGMDPWRDVVDWVGGYPFEVAKPDQIFIFYRKRGFELEKMTTVGGRLGCNEFVFRREGLTGSTCGRSLSVQDPIDPEPRRFDPYAPP